MDRPGAWMAFVTQLPFAQPHPTSLSVCFTRITNSLRMARSNHCHETEDALKFHSIAQPFISWKIKLPCVDGFGRCPRALSGIQSMLDGGDWESLFSAGYGHKGGAYYRVLLNQGASLAEVREICY
jgi:hypothetical protein